ncbi:MAG: helicase-related protein, partial [Nitrospirota bacterium]
GSARVRDALPAGGQGAPQCAIVDVGHRRALDLAIELPAMELSAVCSKEHWAQIHRRLAELIGQHRSTLIFVNTRRLAERVAHQLTELLGPEAVSSHHGSLSKAHRLQTEQRLKTGALRAVVATASLELGIDIGFIDLVAQIGSPRSIATFLQRIGRSGHALGLVPKGRLLPLTRDELIECAALLRAVQAGRLDRIEPPEAPLDILAQQIVAEVACREMTEEELLALCRRAWPYRRLTGEQFESIVRMLSEGVAGRQGRTAALLHRDRVGRVLRARRGSRLVALTSGGAIPELADYRVVLYPEKTLVGSVDEDFAVESLAGDVFLLGNSSWRIQHVRGGEVAVNDAHGAPPTIPFWRGEAPARSRELSKEISALRQELALRVDRPEAAAAWLLTQAVMPERAARQIVDYLALQTAAVGVVPTQEQVLVERFFDEAGGMQLVIHAPFGGRITRAWGLALRKTLCRTFDFELQASADDNGLVLSLGPQQGFPLERVAEMVPAVRARQLLEQALLAAPLFMTRWRWNAARSLAVPRCRGGARVPPPIQRMRADDLLAQVFPQQMACRENLPPGDLPIPDHPLVQQTMRDCLYEATDVEGWLALLQAIASGKVRLTVIETREPSPFSYEILNANPYAFLDDAPLEERRARAVATRRSLTVESLRDLGALDPAAIDQVRAEAWPVVRDADELHDALLGLGLLPAGEGAAWTPWLAELIRAGRAGLARDPGGAACWFATEQWPLARSARPDLAPDREPAVPGGVRLDWPPEEARAALVRGWLDVLGPVAAEQLALRLGLRANHVEATLIALEAQGMALRGTFESSGTPGTQFCARPLLARIHRLTLDRVRRQIQPVTVEQYWQFLLRWQHVEPGAQLRGPAGVAAVIEQLQGVELPAAAWESSILPARVAGYEPAWLDELCLSGDALWGRLGMNSRGS